MRRTRRRTPPRTPPSFPCSTAAVLALAAVPFVACAQESVVLRIAPEPGLVSRYVTEIETRVEGEGVPGTTPGEPMMTGRIFVTQTVTGGEGDARDYEIVFDSASFEMPSMPEMAGAIPDLDGIRQTLSMSTRGEVLEMSIQGEDLPPGFAEAVNQMGGVAGAASLRLPEGPIAVGGTWDARHSMDIPAGPGGSYTMDIEVTYRLDRLEDRGESRLAFLTAEGPMRMSGANPAAGPELSGFQSGTIVIDVGLGRVHESGMEMRTQIGMGGMEITSIQNLSMRLVEG